MGRLIVLIVVLVALGLMLWWLLRRSPDYRLAALEGGTYRFWVQPQHRRKIPEEDALSLPSYYGDNDNLDRIGETLRLPLFSLGGGHSITFNGGTAAWIKRFLWRVYVRAEPGFAVDGRQELTLSATPTGTTFHLSQEVDTPAPPPPKPPKSSRTEAASSDGSLYDYPE